MVVSRLETGEIRRAYVRVVGWRLSVFFSAVAESRAYVRVVGCVALKCDKVDPESRLRACGWLVT